VLSYAVLVNRAASSVHQALRYILRLRLGVDPDVANVFWKAHSSLPSYLPLILGLIGHARHALWPQGIDSASLLSPNPIYGSRMNPCPIWQLSVDLWRILFS
jgi:hypothetical protein